MRNFIVIFVMMIFAFTAKAQQTHVDASTLCKGEVYEFFDPGNTTGIPDVSVTADQSFADSAFLYGASGSEDTLMLTLNVNPTYSHTDAVTVLDIFLPYTYGDETFPVGTTSGDYPITFKTVSGCDSTVILTLTVNEYDQGKLGAMALFYFPTSSQTTDSIGRRMLGGDSVYNASIVFLAINLLDFEFPAGTIFTYEVHVGNETTPQITANDTLQESLGSEDYIMSNYYWYVLFGAKNSQLGDNYITAEITKINGINVNSMPLSCVYTFTKNNSITSIDVLKSAKLYPNPVSGSLKIENLEDATNVNIYNVMGQIVRTIPSATGSIDVDMSDLSNGLYFIKMQNGKNVRTEKIQVVK
jgi:hypothetical protein